MVNSKSPPASAAHLASAIVAPLSILVTGGTGFIGSRLVSALVDAGHTVTVLSRSRAKTSAGPLKTIHSFDEIGNDARIDAIINLAGEPISDSPWTKSKRIKIVRSRLSVTYGAVRLIARLQSKPAIFISGSAIGYYGLQGDEKMTETSAGNPCFSRRICASWERAANRAAAYGVRTATLRIGLVLDSGGGMLARLLLPFKLGLGGRFGSGAHWMSWIHRDDLVRLICHIIATDKLSGPVNGTAPEPMTNRAFTSALAKALSRPAIFPIPAGPLRLILGDFAHELLLSGQRVHPEAALNSGFAFDYPNLDKALAQILGK